MRKESVSEINTIYSSLYHHQSASVVQACQLDIHQPITRKTKARDYCIDKQK